MGNCAVDPCLKMTNIKHPNPTKVHVLFAIGWLSKSHTSKLFVHADLKGESLAISGGLVLDSPHSIEGQVLYFALSILLPDLNHLGSLTRVSSQDDKLGLVSLQKNRIQMSTHNTCSGLVEQNHRQQNEHVYRLWYHTYPAHYYVCCMHAYMHTGSQCLIGL